MFYGLAEMENDYYAEKVDKFIALAPCVYYKTDYTDTADIANDWEKYRDNIEHFVVKPDIEDQPISTNSMFYAAQIAVEDKFQ